MTVTCPCSIFGLGQTPFTPSSGDTGSVEVGVKFSSQVSGWITGVSFYKGAGNTGTHIGNLWTSTGQRLASAVFVNETSTGWQEADFGVPVPVTAGTTYVASYYAPNGDYAADNLNGDYASRDEGLDKGAGSGPLQALPDGTSGGNGVFSYGGDAFPISSFGATNYWVDPVLATTLPPDTSPPVVMSVTPLDGSTSVPPTTTASAIFDEPVQPAMTSFTLTGPGNTPVPGTTSYDAALQTATFTPSSPLATGTTYSASVAGETDLAGNVQANATQWTFTTATAPNPPGLCPCSIWNDGTQPGILTVNDPRAVELGVRFHADQDGVISGVRFFKGPGNGGAHTASLWTSTGQLLATATFANESTTGWQTVTFSSAVPITAGTDYVASYHTNSGNYSETPGLFTGQGADDPPLHADADNSPTAPNGVFTYGSGGFPTSSAAGASYLVDVVFTPGLDATPPSVVTTGPTAGTTSVPTSMAITATMSESIQAASAHLTVTGPGGSVAGVVSYSPTSLVVTFTPSTPLSAASTYTASLSGATDLAGNTMVGSTTWSFTTSGAGACPCTLFSSTQRPGTADSGDPNAVELGMQFSPDANGWITGVRFYKSAANTGVHTGALWTSSGTLLASGTFGGESATGWQTLTFGTAVPVTAGTTYVASYYAPSGHYSQDVGFFSQPDDNSPLHAPASTTSTPNGLYTYAGAVFPTISSGASNYWVDPVFSSVAPAGVQATSSPAATSSPPPVPMAAALAIEDRTLAYERSDEEHAS